MKNFVVIIIIGFIWSCAPTKFVKPLEKNQKAIGFNFGGPLIKFGEATIPIPFTSIYAGYGWKEKTTLHAGLHLTSMAYQTLQFDLGILQGIYNQNQKFPGISLGGTFNLMTSLRDSETRFYPQLDANFYWEYSQNKWMTYIGTSNWIDLQKETRVQESKHKYIHPTFHFGQSYKWKKMEIGVEYKYLVPFTENKNTIIDFVTRGDKGANGVYLNIKRTF